MKNNIYEVPKALVLNVNSADVITTSTPFNDYDTLFEGWVSAGEFFDQDACSKEGLYK